MCHLSKPPIGGALEEDWRRIGGALEEPERRAHFRDTFQNKFTVINVIVRQI